MDIKQKIEILFNSNLSGYAIAKDSGVPQSTINKLMNEQIEIENLSLGNAQKLVDLYDERINSVELPEEYKDIRDVLRYEFKEILDGQLEVYREIQLANDKLVFNYLHDEFQKTLNDNQTIFEVGDIANNMVEPVQQMIDEL